MEKKLYRSRQDRVISGVCGGLGSYLGVDPTVLRVVAALLAFVSFGTAILIYLVLALIVPLAPENALTPSEGKDVTSQ